MKRGSDRRKFTKEFKIEAVRLVDQPGMSVPENTLYRWQRELTEDGVEAFRGQGRLRSDTSVATKRCAQNAKKLHRQNLKFPSPRGRCLYTHQRFPPAHRQGSG
jgi:transposase